MKCRILYFVLILGITSLLVACKPKEDLPIKDDNEKKLEVISLSKQDLSLEGFASLAFTSNIIMSPDDSRYYHVYTPSDFYRAITDKNSKVIEIMNDLDLGHLSFSQSERANSNFFAKSVLPSVHPTLVASGISRIRIQDRNGSNKNAGLVIFSNNGSTIKHAGFIIKRVDNLIIRNLKFLELWEWDEATKGDYDKNDWDYITLEECNGVWIDHCTFGKSYDGLIDAKEGCQNITISWCKFITEPDFVRIQMEYLEQHIDNYPMYRFFRDQGISLEDMIKIAIPQKKGHLIGSGELNDKNNIQTLTIHNCYYEDLQDRLTRLRGGDAHLYNIYQNCNNSYEAKKRRDTYQIASSNYKFGITSQSIISTENGAILLENAILEGVIDSVRNNQKSGYPSQYTGKIKVLNSIYKLGNVCFRGGSDELNSPFKSKQVSMLSFSWNNFTTLPYQYQIFPLDDLKVLLNDAQYGCGSGVIQWIAREWLKITYKGE